MPLHDIFSLQILALHDAILDNCDRATRQTDAMALRLRANALALTRAQLVLLSYPGEPAPAETAQAAEAETLSPPPLPETEPDRAPDPAPGRRLAGDGLSRFVSRRIAPDESIHAAWQRSLREASAGGRKRNPDSPPSVFRSPSG